LIITKSSHFTTSNYLLKILIGAKQDVDELEVEVLHSLVNATIWRCFFPLHHVRISRCYVDPLLLGLTKASFLLFLLQTFHLKSFSSAVSTDPFPNLSSSPPGIGTVTISHSAMEHRQKRVRLDDAEGPLHSLASSASVVTSSAAPDTTSDAAPETTEDTSTLSPEPVRTPDKSTWQGWAEIENDPVCSYLQMSEVLR
jgi:hypothetical protein